MQLISIRYNYRNIDKCMQDYLLPRSLTLRLAKAVLPPNTAIQKDAVLAIQKAATVFVSYLASQYVFSFLLPFQPLIFM